MQIGRAARASGVSAKMLWYYGSIGLLGKAGRTEAGYWIYSEADVGTLWFVRRARDLGLPLDRIKLLIGLWKDEDRASADVKRIATEHAAELRAKIRELTRRCEALEGMAAACHGDHRPECPILDEIAEGTQDIAASAASAKKQQPRREALGAAAHRVNQGAT